jgi:hypothetical protein
MALPVGSRRSTPPLRTSGGRHDAAVRAAAATRRRIDQGIAVLRRLVPLANRLSHGVRIYVALVGAAAATIATMLLWRMWPSSITDVIVLVVLLAWLAAPVLVLWLFHRALAEVVEIPARLAATPEVARAHGGELAALVRDAQGRRGRVRLLSLPGDLWRAGRLLLAAHDDLPGYGAVLTLVSVPFLLASAAAAVVGLLEIVCAPAVVVGAVLTALV